MEKSGGELRSSTTERTISSGLLLLWGCRKRIKRLMETVGRPPRRTPIQEHQIVEAFHRTALQLAAILLLILFSDIAAITRDGDKTYGRSSRGRKLWLTFNGLLIWGRTPVARRQAGKPEITSSNNCAIRAGR